VAVFRLPAVAAAGLLVLVLVLVLLPSAADVPDELHAASTVAAAATASSASSIRRRAGPLLIRCAPPMLPRPGIVRVLMISCPLCRVSAPGQPDGMGGNDCLAGAVGSIRGSATFFSRNSNMLICSFFSFIPLDSWRQGQTRLLC
jgi:hypothetical protein